MAAEQATRERQAMDRRTWLLNSALALTGGRVGTAHAGGGRRHRREATCYCPPAAYAPVSAPTACTPGANGIGFESCGPYVVNAFIYAKGCAYPTGNTGWPLAEVYGAIYQGTSEPGNPWDQTISDTLGAPTWEFWGLEGAICEYPQGPYPANRLKVWAEYDDPAATGEVEQHHDYYDFNGICQDTGYETQGLPVTGTTPTTRLVAARVASDVIPQRWPARHLPVYHQPIWTANGWLYNRLWLDSRHYGNVLLNRVGGFLSATEIEVWVPTVNWYYYEGTNRQRVSDAEGASPGRAAVEAQERAGSHWRFPSQIHGTTYQHGICIWQLNGGWWQLPAGKTTPNSACTISNLNPAKPILVQVNGRRYQFDKHWPPRNVNADSISLGVRVVR